MSQGMERAIFLFLILLLAGGATPTKAPAKKPATSSATAAKKPAGSSSAAKKPASPALPAAKPFDAPLAKSPLTPPLEVTGGFGEYRQGHFHAGFDFGTGKKVGQSVYAPLAGHVERIRASGVGYGRSIYLRTKDGRLLQFGHLDAFAEPMASYVRAAQDSAGIYEQDLWPEASRFPITLGQRIAWTGESGAGGPHMHFEIRRGDMAYHPQLAGLTVKDNRAPSIASITLEPLDDSSFVEGSAAPLTRKLGAKPETLRVVGRMRAIVSSRDGVWSGVDRMVPWVTRMAWGDQWVECRMDSISWATDMSEGDYVYDAGRVVGDKGIVLWASRGFRPRFIRASAPLAEEAGTIEVRPGDTPLTVKLEARDVAGNVGRRTVVLRPGPSKSETLDPLQILKGGIPAGYRFAALPYGYFRVTSPGRSGVTEIRAPRWKTRFGVTNANPTSIGQSSEGLAVVERETYSVTQPRVTIVLPQSARFDSSAYLVQTGPRDSLVLPPKSDELAQGVLLAVVWPREPLRARAQLTFSPSGKPHSGVYRYDEDGWTWVGDTKKGLFYDVSTSSLGWFAEFQDTLSPRITLRTPARTAVAGAYSRWAVEAGVVEKGSGVNARACYFIVEGKKVAAEWDPEADVLRWRPLKKPAAGTYKYDVIAEDRAGNASIRSGTFALD